MDSKAVHNILVTGKKSYIGNSFIEYARRKQLPIRIDTISMRDSSYRTLNYSDYCSIVHVSAIVHQRNRRVRDDEFWKVNVENTYELAVLAKEAGVRQFVYLSSMAVYGVDTTRINQNTIPHPESIYAKTKLIAENKLLELEDKNFKIAILRPPMVYGKGCPGNYKLLSKLSRNLRMFPNIQNQRSMIYIKNLCSFIGEIIVKEYQGIYHPRNPEYVSTFELVQKIGDCHGHKVKGFSAINPVISYLRKRIGIFKKIFGDLTYEYDLSSTVENEYINFDQSIEETERS